VAVLGFPPGPFEGLLALTVALGLLKAGPVALGLLVASPFAGRHPAQVAVVVKRSGRGSGGNEEGSGGNEGKKGGFHDGERG